MAYAMTKCGSRDNIITYEFMCDTIADMNAIENEYRTLGSVAIVLQGESDGLEVYIAGSNKQWTSLTAMTGSNSETGGLSIYICGQNEVSEGLPDVEEPDETTIYLVPASQESNNLYEEYIWTNDAWEKFGGASIDLSNYATLNDISGFYTKPNDGIPAADLAETYLTQHQDISGKANSADLATVATSGSYNDLSNKPTIPDVSGFYTKPAGGIPAADLAETYLTQHQDISGKANSADLAAVATSGSYNDLSNKPAAIEAMTTSEADEIFDGVFSYMIMPSGDTSTREYMTSSELDEMFEEVFGGGE